MEGVPLNTFPERDTSNTTNTNDDLISASPLQQSPIDHSGSETGLNLPEKRVLTFDDPWSRIRHSSQNADDEQQPAPDTIQNAITLTNDKPATTGRERRFSNIIRRLSSARPGSVQKIVSQPYLTFTPVVGRNSV